MITQAELKAIMHYDPDTGVFTRISARGCGKAGAVVGSLSQGGYLRTVSYGKGYQMHRLAWLYMTGAWPTQQIDHINQNRTDNRWGNLRDVPHDVNVLNQAIRKTNTSGVTGVMWHKRVKKWVAQIQIEGRRKHIGYYSSKEAAAVARLKANELYGFHPNHGSDKHTYAVLD